jgi:ankyrin repeat protein
MLEQPGAEVNSKDSFGRMLLSRLAKDCEANVKLSLPGADVVADSKDDFGWTPLSWVPKNVH